MDDVAEAKHGLRVVGYHRHFFRRECTEGRLILSKIGCEEINEEFTGGSEDSAGDPDELVLFATTNINKYMATDVDVEDRGRWSGKPIFATKALGRRCGYCLSKSL